MYWNSSQSVYVLSRARCWTAPQGPPCNKSLGMSMQNFSPFSFATPFDSRELLCCEVYLFSAKLVAGRMINCFEMFSDSTKKASSPTVDQESDHLSVITPSCEESGSFSKQRESYSIMSKQRELNSMLVQTEPVMRSALIWGTKKKNASCKEWLSESFNVSYAAHCPVRPPRFGRAEWSSRS